MTPEQFDDLLDRVAKALELIAKGQKLTVADVATLNEGMRCAKVPMNERNGIGEALAKADRAYLMPNTVPPPPVMPAQSQDDVAALVKKVKKGDHVWFERDDKVVRGLVNKVMARTVCIEIADEKDLQIPKSQLLAVEES